MTEIDQEQIKLALDCLNEHEDDHDVFTQMMWDALDDGCKEQLNQLLHQGPVYDGNVVSKSDRDFLIDHLMATRCCYMGEDGYTAATYLGKQVFGRGDMVPMKTMSPQPS